MRPASPDVLRQGMRGPAVRRWQQFLLAEGHLAGTADGVFGPRTVAATRAFQAAHTLAVDGKVGPATRRAAADVFLAALVPAVVEPAVTPPDTAEPAADTPAVVADAAASTPAVGYPLGVARLRRVMPGIRPATCATCAPFLEQAMAEFAINSPARAAAFLAQLAHESGQLRWFEEIWGPTAAQRRYEPPSSLARRLGNVRPGDGKRFKGRGPIQLTGRSNYQRYGTALGVDLVADPPRAATHQVGFRIAGLFWQRNGLNELADQQRFRGITRRINGGFNGLADRVRFYERAKVVFGVATIRVRDDGRHDAGWWPFRRGLDGPGERTPTAAERNARPPVPARRKRAATRVTKKRVTKPAARGRPRTKRTWAR